MKKITKKENKKFILEIQKELVNIGAVPYIIENFEFHLKTKKHGVLWLRIDIDNSFCFTLYGRFLSIENLPNINTVNNYSGKFNHHLSGIIENVVRGIILNIKSILN